MKKASKFWAMVDPKRKQRAEEFIRKISRGLPPNIHRRIFRSAKFGD